MPLQYEMPDPNNPRHKDHLLVCDHSTKDRADIDAMIAMTTQDLEVMEVLIDLCNPSRVLNIWRPWYTEHKESLESAAKYKARRNMWTYFYIVRRVRRKMERLQSDIRSIKYDWTFN